MLIPLHNINKYRKRISTIHGYIYDPEYEQFGAYIRCDLFDIFQEIYDEVQQTAARERTAQEFKQFEDKFLIPRARHLIDLCIYNPEDTWRHERKIYHRLAAFLHAVWSHSFLTTSWR